jgi:hypothetical protein
MVAFWRYLLACVEDNFKCWDFSSLIFNHVFLLYRLHTDVRLANYTQLNAALTTSIYIYL